jgi:hypothetical protein
VVAVDGGMIKVRALMAWQDFEHNNPTTAGIEYKVAFVGQRIEHELAELARVAEVVVAFDTFLPANKRDCRLRPFHSCLF